MELKVDILDSKARDILEQREFNIEKYVDSISNFNRHKFKKIINSYKVDSKLSNYVVTDYPKTIFNINNSETHFPASTLLNKNGGIDFFFNWYFLKNQEIDKNLEKRKIPLELYIEDSVLHEYTHGLCKAKVYFDYKNNDFIQEFGLSKTILNFDENNKPTKQTELYYSLNEGITEMISLDFLLTKYSKETVLRYLATHSYKSMVKELWFSLKEIAKNPETKEKNESEV